MADNDQIERAERFLRMMDGRRSLTKEPVSPEGFAEQVVRQTFADLGHDAFKFPEGVNPKLKMTKNA